jgi:hypothetical protein
VRRAVVGLAIAAIATLGVGAGSASAASKVVASGAIQCALTGHAKVSPALVTGGTFTTVMKYKAMLSNCTGTNHAPAPAGITGGKVKGVLTLPSNNCTTAFTTFLESGVTNSFTVRWTGAGRYVSSVATIPADPGPQVRAFLALGDTTNATNAFTVGNAGPTATIGSFAGTNVGLVFGSFDQPGAQEHAACQPKTKGVRGSGGVKRLTFSPTAGIFGSYILFMND